MPFQPEKITREHVLEALAKIDKENKPLKGSTIYDLHFEGKTYPPKEVMRDAHQIAVGERVWKRSGGPPTNDFLIKLGFTVVTKSEQPDPFPGLIRDYKALISTQGLSDELYKWELLEEFKGMPNPEASDFSLEMKSVNFANLIYGPGLGVMQQLAKNFPVEYRECYFLLFDEQRELQERVELFTKQAGILYRKVEADEKKQAHHDERTIATILTYHDPGTYTLYKDSFYQTLCKVLGIKAADAGKKYVHYLTLVNRFIDEYIKDDQELLDLVAKYKSANAFSDTNFKILAQDILYRMLEINGRTFNALVDELAQSLEDDQFLPRFKVVKEVSGKEGKGREWVWISDSSGIIGNVTAHYEMEIPANKRDKIRISLHFEDERNNKKFISEVGKELPDGLRWFSWFKADSIRFKNDLNFYSEKAVEQIIECLKYLDTQLGDKIRYIVQQPLSKERKMNTDASLSKFPLNQILYGPPGTGKTYHTISKALEILGEGIQRPRKELKEIFDQHVRDQRIVFTTFHQSLSYEDFVEGIKPVENDDPSQSIQYETKAGIFKNICNTARGLQEIKRQPEDLFNQAKFFKMSLGGLQNPHIHDWCIKNSCIGLGWGGEKNYEAFKSIRTWDEFRDKFVQEFPDLVSQSRFHIVAMFTFFKMKVGDIVVITKGNHIIDAIGKVTGEYFWNDSNDFEYYQFRKVEWLVKDLNQDPSIFFKKKISQQSIYPFFEDDVKRETFKTLFKKEPEGEEAGQKPYVLIIDEINRGNVSKIFGELITLLEKDKRLGNEEAVTLTLPYSRESFGVPSNLFIIGTMNTADRSVEALDTALRRRFCFEEMQPEAELLSPGHILWRFLWKYENYEWEDVDYKKKELEVFELLGVSEEFKNDRYKIWEAFMQNDDQESQINLVKKYAYTNINLQKVLNTINNRLEVLKDRDHQIGHAYFIHVYSLRELMDVFRDCIVPLLQEYFFGDYYKIQLVLGPGFITSSQVKISFAIDEDEEYDDKRIYSINKDALNNVEKFVEALKSMKIQ